MLKDDFFTRLYTKKSVEQVNKKVLLLGDNFKMSISKYMTLRLLFCIFTFFMVVYLFDFGYIIAPVVFFATYYLFTYLTLDREIKKRGRKLNREALEFFEILTLTLESGRNLEHALEITVFNVESELSSEFKKTLFEVKFGKSLVEALEAMKKRIPSETINNIILNITQTNVFGNSILETMYNQIDFLRDKQILEIKGQINKIPNKISIISVLFMVPLILLLVLGPVVINFLN